MWQTMLFPQTYMHLANQTIKQHTLKFWWKPLRWWALYCQRGRETRASGTRRYRAHSRSGCRRGLGCVGEGGWAWRGGRRARWSGGGDSGAEGCPWLEGRWRESYWRSWRTLTASCGRKTYTRRKSTMQINTFKEYSDDSIAGHAYPVGMPRIWL